MNLVTGPLGSVVNKLGQLLKDEYNLQTGVKKKIRCLARDLESMHAALRKVAEVPPDQLDDEVKLWARDVRELSYDAEDILDDFLVRVDGREARDDDPNRFKRAVKKMGKLFSKSKARHQIGGMIKIINEQADAVAERHRRYRAEDIVSKPAPSRTVDPRLEAMYTEVTQLVGIEKPSGKLISMLSSPLGDQEMKMVSVIGAGGLGKTTLVKAVYDKLRVDFQCTAFVSVGRDPDLKKVFIDILIELDKKEYMDPKYRLLDGNQLIKELREYLQDKRYFIVIDDVWETEAWKRINYALVRNNNGSRVISTTRHSNVSDQVGEVYVLDPLPPDSSEKLFHTRIFGANGKCPNNKLKEVSKKILSKCHGVPLAIITMASLLVGKSTAEWTEVCNSIVFRDKKNNQQVNDTEWILSLSYYDLPPHLKTCLLYLSVFPEDCLIRKDRLIWKWVAEGFVHKGPGSGSLFEIGERYFNELVNRSMIQAVKSGCNGLVYDCRIHDMVLDLLRAKSQEENFVTIISGDNNEDTSSPNNNIRRLVHQKRTVVQALKNTQENLLHVRTFMAVSCRSDLLSFFSFSFLRVLALEDWDFRDGLIHLEHIESLLHLRYFGLIGTYVTELPKGIGALLCLQTLNLLGTYLEELPSSISMLTQLICLHAGRAKVPKVIIQKLTSLEELQIHALGDTAREFVKDLGNLCELRVLEASVKVTDSDLVESICKLHKLQHLTLHNSYFPRARGETDNAMWDAAMLPQTLRHFIVQGMEFTVLPSCINPSALPNLIDLELDVRKMDEQSLRILGRLPELRRLHLWTVYTVSVTVHQADQDACFQKLRILSLPESTVHFALNEDLSVTFTIWEGDEDGVAFDSEKGLVCAPAVIMPNLRLLQFQVVVQTLMDSNGSCGRLGLHYLPSLQEVTVNFACLGVFADDVETEEVALRHAVDEAHPNRPTLQITHSGYQDIKRRVTSVSVCHHSPASHDLTSEEGQNDVPPSPASDDPARAIEPEESVPAYC